LILAADEGWRGHQIEHQHPSFHHAHAPALNSCRCTPARTKHKIPDPRAASLLPYKLGRSRADRMSQCNRARCRGRRDAEAFNRPRNVAL
jgi:hypothetical protein